MNMSKRKIYLSVVLAILLLAACDKDDTPTGETESGGRVALQVCGGIQTRAVDNRWEAGDVIGIYMLKTDGGSAVDTYANVPYEVAESGESGMFTPLQGSMTIYLPVDGTKRDFIACYPHKELEDNSIYTIDLSVQAEQSKIDFMVADRVTGKSREDAAVAFDFKHKLAKVVLSVKTGSGFADDQSGLAALTKVTLTGQQTTGSYSVLSGGDVSIAAGEGEISLKVNKEDVKSCTAEGIVFPSANYTGMVFRFDMGTSGQYEWKLFDSNESSKFEAGRKYKYGITINKSGLEVTSTITDWSEGNGGGETGSAE